MNDITAAAHVVVAAVSSSAFGRASHIAKQLTLPLVSDWRVSTAAIALLIDIDSAALQLITPRPPGPVMIDFASPRMEYRRKGGQNELLGRAVGVRQGRSLTILDATAGLGRDAFVLADLGCRVMLVEQLPILAWLLNEALAAAQISASEHVRAAAKRMQVRCANSMFLTAESGVVIYLDPMFPDRGHSAAVKKELAVLQALHGDNATIDQSKSATDEQLLEWALAQSTPRVVVKRPLRAAPLSGKAPSHAVAGKAVRFDVYVLGNLA